MGSKSGGDAAPLRIISLKLLDVLLSRCSSKRELKRQVEGRGAQKVEDHIQLVMLSTPGPASIISRPEAETCDTCSRSLVKKQFLKILAARKLVLVVRRQWEA